MGQTRTPARHVLNLPEQCQFSYITFPAPSNHCTLPAGCTGDLQIEH